jgi:large subunit ribosomal protein L21
MYAIIETGNKQYRVEKGTVLSIEKLPEEKGKTVSFDRVLLTSADGQVRVGTPTLAGARVTAELMDHYKDDKVVTFKKRRRHGYQRTHGHRQILSQVKITDIQAG